jgi:hypothetical protein
MLRITHGTGAGVRFCEGCAQVTTAARRACRRHDRIRAQAAAWAWPR